MEASATPFRVVKARSAVGAGLVDARGAIEALVGGAGSPEPFAPAPQPPPAEATPTPAPTPTPTPTPPVTPAEEAGAAAAKPPVARIAAHPRRLVKTRRRRVRLTFRFAADRGGVHFLCEFRPGRSVACPARVTRGFTAGPHRVAVRAVDASGEVGGPAAFRFRVERVRGRHARR
jgi:hypothetical protein